MNAPVVEPNERSQETSSDDAASDESATNVSGSDESVTARASEPSVLERREAADASDADVALHGTFMGAALVEAHAARAAGEVPIGCVLVHDGAIVARGHNLRERAQDPTAHAEIVALKAAAARLGTWRLSGVTAYVTLEPCPMCAGALVNARVDRVVYGAADPKAGATETLYRIGSDPRLNHRFSIVRGVRAAECGALLSEFFAGIRAAQKRSRSRGSSLR